MFRWKYVIPRLVILICFVGGFWVVMNPALRWALIQGGQAATGATVEIRRLRSLLSRAEIQLDAVKIADPQSSMQNLLRQKPRCWKSTSHSFCADDLSLTKVILVVFN